MTNGTKHFINFSSTFCVSSFKNIEKIRSLEWTTLVLVGRCEAHRRAGVHLEDSEPSNHKMCPQALRSTLQTTKEISNASSLTRWVYLRVRTELDVSFPEWFI